MTETIKFLGGVLILIGVPLLFIAPPLGALLLAVTGIASFVIRTQEKRRRDAIQEAILAKLQ